eukprot:1157154-Pelagomonas_calceolata.AAC.2
MVVALDANEQHRLQVALDIHLPVMAAVCCHEGTPPCALLPVGSWLYVFQPHAPASAGFVVPKYFECRKKTVLDGAPA